MYKQCITALQLSSQQWQQATCMQAVRPNDNYGAAINQNPPQYLMQGATQAAHQN